jgi:hypothetical protein
MGGMRRLRRSVAKAQGIPWAEVQRAKRRKLGVGQVVVPAITVETPKRLTRWQRFKAWWKSWFR